MSIILPIAIENIRMGTNRGRVSTLVIESLLFLEIVIEEVIEEIKTILRRERVSRVFIEKRYDKLIFKIIKMIGENIKNKISKLRYIIIFLTKTIISSAKGERIYCWSLASVKSEAYTFSTLINEIKKIIIHKNASGISMSKAICLKAKEKIEEEIINKQNKTKVKILPLIIKENSLAKSLRKFLIMLIRRFYGE